MSAGAASGKVAWLGKVTVDNRKLANLDVPKTAVPLMYLRHQEEGHRGSEVAGAVHARVQRGVLLVDGDVYDTGIPAGEYACGVDVDGVALQHDGDGPTVVNGARLIAVTMYAPDSGAVPSFPDAKVTVTR